MASVDKPGSKVHPTKPQQRSKGARGEENRPTVTTLAAQAIEQIFWFKVSLGEPKEKIRYGVKRVFLTRRQRGGVDGETEDGKRPKFNDRKISLLVRARM